MKDKSQGRTPSDRTYRGHGGTMVTDLRLHLGLEIQGDDGLLHGSYYMSLYSPPRKWLKQRIVCFLLRVRCNRRISPQRGQRKIAQGWTILVRARLVDSLRHRPLYVARLAVTIECRVF